MRRKTSAPTCISVHFVRSSRFGQVRKRGFECVVGSQDIDIHHGLERVRGQLIDRGEEITCRTSTRNAGTEAS
jgi:hypothetical protein